MIHCGLKQKQGKGNLEQIGLTDNMKSTLRPRTIMVTIGSLRNQAHLENLGSYMRIFTV